MRFEIRSGGVFVILIGLVALSTAVFLVGLVAGYEMARQTQPDMSQIASMFPAPSAPAASPGAAASPAAQALASPAAPASAAPDTAAAPAAHRAPSIAHAAPSPATVAKVSAAASAAAPRQTPAPAEERAAAAPPTHRPHPYNIQIDAVMDKSGADQMIGRLKALGFNSYAVPTTVNGQTWYRVRVGPYDSQDAAAAAQARLRSEYSAAYSSH
jgi:cell division septation protein DedD